jgi:hypothetical protein
MTGFERRRHWLQRDDQRGQRGASRQRIFQ